MELIALIFSGLALLAACVSLHLLMREKKRNHERNAAVLSYVDTSVESAKNDAVCYATDLTDGMADRLNKLEKGIVPDYEQAMAAANAVNDFNKGISNILGYDPGEALRAQREKERQGEAV